MLKDFKDKLETVCDNVSHFESKGEKLPRIVFAETGRNYYCYDNITDKKSFNVDVHFYTDKEYDPTFEALEELFIDNGIPFDLDGIQFGRDDKGRSAIYYLFKCEV